MVIERLWQDECGFIISMELILIVSIMIIGIMMGMVSVRDGVISELSDVAGAIQDINQTYSYRAVIGHSSSTAGSSWLDRRDWCDIAEDQTNRAENGILFSNTPTNEL